MPADSLPSVSFIVTALNEQDVVGAVIQDIWDAVSKRLDDYELILINDGSTDRTGSIMDEVARRLPKIRVLHNRTNMGLGASYQRGVAEAKLEYVMMLCGDGGLPASSLPPILEQIGKADIVIPYMINLRKIKTPTRYFISRAYTRLLNLLSGHELHYYNGLPVHRRAALLRTPITGSGFGFQGEILVRLLKSGFSYVEVGVLGAEATNRSSALRLGNFVSVAKTIFKLIELVVVLSLYRGNAAAHREAS